MLNTSCRLNVNSPSYTLGIFIIYMMLLTRHVVFQSDVIYLNKKYDFFFLGTQALQDAGLDYSSIEQAVVGYCFGKNYVDGRYHKEEKGIW